MFKNQGSQKATVFAFDRTTGQPKTGDSANITLYVSKDDGAPAALAAASVTEVDATNAPGDYSEALAQAETNADKVRITGKSTTTNIVIVPQTFYTLPANFTATAIDSSGKLALTSAEHTAISGSDVPTAITAASLATHADVTAIQNNTDVVIVPPDQMPRPVSGSATYSISILVYDESNNMVDPDSSTVTIHAANAAGSSRDTGLDSTTATRNATGDYRSTYAVASTDAAEQIVFRVTMARSSLSRTYARTSLVADAYAVDFNSSDRSTLGTIATQIGTAGAGLTAIGDARLGGLVTAIGSPSGASLAADVAAVKSDTTTALARLGAWTGSGLNTILGGIRALAAKASGLLPSDLSSGTTFNNATDSLEAISEETGVSVLPVISTVSSGEVKCRKLAAYQFAAFGPYAFTITDQTGAAVNLSGRSISFIAETTDAVWLWQLDDCTVGGSDNNVVTVSADDTNSATAGAFRYVLRDQTADSVIARGELTIYADADAQ